jgi:hypothetical protein
MGSSWYLHDHIASLGNTAMTMDITKMRLPYRSSPLDHQGLWCCILFMVEKKILGHRVGEFQLRQDGSMGRDNSHLGP